jgi:hypothetical protein
LEGGQSCNGHVALSSGYSRLKTPAESPTRP